MTLECESAALIWIIRPVITLERLPGQACISTDPKRVHLEFAAMNSRILSFIRVSDKSTHRVES